MISLRRLACGVVMAVCAAANSPVLAANGGVVMDAQTETALERVYRFLASHQAADGSWPGISERERRYPAAVTAYASMAFLAGGHVPGEGPFGDRVARAIGYLAAQVDDGGLIDGGRGGHYMYSHGISAIVLAEACGMTGGSDARDALRRMIRVVVSSQNDEGGWRYRPMISGADISVTALQVVALRAAVNSGLYVPQQTIDRAVAYVRSCWDEGAGGFLYQPQDKDAGFARTAAAVYSLQVCGEYDDPRIAPAIEFLFRSFEPGSQWFAYGNFYAAPALYMIGGEAWQRWYHLVRPELLGALREGPGGTAFWDAELDPAGGVGPIYSTAVFATVLAVPNHCLPLYQR